MNWKVPSGGPVPVLFLALDVQNEDTVCSSIPHTSDFKNQKS